MTWKPVVGFEGLYEVSNTGQVRHTSTGKIVKQYKQRCGTVVVYLYDKQRHTRIRTVASLVATAFVPKTSNGKYAQHKDGDSSNNNSSNLYWSKYKGRPEVKVVDKLTGCVYNSMREAARNTDVSRNTIMKSVYLGTFLNKRDVRFVIENTHDKEKLTGSTFTRK